MTYPTVFDIRVRPRIVSSRTGTKDLQQVQLSLRILSRPKKEKLPEIMINLGEDWDERVLPSIVNEVLKATVAQYDAEQLLTEREAVSRKIRCVRWAGRRRPVCRCAPCARALPSSQQPPSPPPACPSCPPPPSPLLQGCAGEARGRVQHHPGGRVHHAPHVLQGVHHRH